MGCGCKSKTTETTTTTQQSTTTNQVQSSQPVTESLKDTIKKTIEKYYYVNKSR